MVNTLTTELHLDTSIMIPLDSTQSKCIHDRVNHRSIVFIAEREREREKERERESKKKRKNEEKCLFMNFVNIISENS